MRKTRQSNSSEIRNDDPRYTNLKRRLLAFGIDLFLYIIAFVVMIRIVDYVDQELRKARNSANNQVSGFVVFAVAFVILWLYHALMESSKFQGTVGKILIGVKVVNSSKSRVTFAQGTIRLFAKFGLPAVLIIISALIGMPFLTAIVALLMLWLIRSAALNPRRQGFHDVAAGTRVIDK